MCSIFISYSTKTFGSTFTKNAVLLKISLMYILKFLQPFLPLVWIMRYKKTLDILNKMFYILELLLLLLSILFFLLSLLLLLLLIIPIILFFLSYWTKIIHMTLTSEISFSEISMTAFSNMPFSRYKLYLFRKPFRICPSAFEKKNRKWEQNKFP